MDVGPKWLCLCFGMVFVPSNEVEMGYGGMGRGGLSFVESASLDSLLDVSRDVSLDAPAASPVGDRDTS